MDSYHVHYELDGRKRVACIGTDDPEVARAMVAGTPGVKILDIVKDVGGAAVTSRFADGAELHDAQVKSNAKRT